jgi:phytoene desaturase
VKTVSGPTDHVVVVGAGLSGLSAALHLLGAGRRVTLVERADHPGGRAGALDLETAAGTYRVDTGPTVLTMPSLLEEAFATVGEKLEERLDLVRLDPGYRARFADGSTIDVHTDADAMEAEIRRVCGPDSAAGYGRLRTWLTQLYQAEIDRFIGANFDSPLGLLGPDLARLAALGGFGRLAPRIARYLPDERLQRIFSFQALYAGVPPQRALGAYGVIAYMDTIAGCSSPGGMRQVGRGLPARRGGRRRGDRVRACGDGTGVIRRTRHAVRHRAVDGGPTERSACDAGCSPRICRWCTGSSAGRRTVPCRCGGRPSAVVLHAGVTRPRQSWPTTRSRSARRGVDPGRSSTRAG